MQINNYLKLTKNKKNFYFVHFYFGKLLFCPLLIFNFYFVTFILKLLFCRRTPPGIVIFGEQNLNANSFPEFHEFPDELKSLLLQFPNSGRNLEYYGALEVTVEEFSLSWSRIVNFR